MAPPQRGEEPLKASPPPIAPPNMAPPQHHAVRSTSKSNSTTLLVVGLVGLAAIAVTLVLATEPSSDPAATTGEVSNSWFLNVLPIALPLILVATPFLIVIGAILYSRRRGRDV